MAAATIEQVYDRVCTLVASAPYSMTRAEEPFSFDLQPATKVDETYHVEATLLGAEGYLGYQQGERWQLRFWLARKTKRNPHAAYRALLVDVSSLTASLAREGLGAVDYDVETDSVRTEVPEPVEEADYQMALLEAVATFDRAL